MLVYHSPFFRRVRAIELLELIPIRKKIELLKKKKSPFRDEKVSHEFSHTEIEFTTSPVSVREADIIIVCVPTPVYDDHTPNLEPLESAAKSIAPYLRKGGLVVIESTINPGVSEDIVLPILKKGSGLRGGEFYLSHCPERINPGDTTWTLESIPRVVGSLTEDGLKKTIDFYESILKTPVRAMGSLKEAEAVKVVENSFRDVNIAFVNELAMSFDRLGIDVVNVIEGAATKPFSFMPHFPGSGVGGHCIPVDPYYLISYGKKNGFAHHFLSLARKINNYMPIFTVDLLDKELRGKEMRLAGSKVAVLGLSYKPNVDDTRESPSFEIIEILKSRGAHPVPYDPYAAQFSEAESLGEAVEGVVAVIIATAHKEFLSITPEYLLRKGVRVLIDGRNCLPKELFLTSPLSYAGIGR